MVDEHQRRVVRATTPVVRITPETALTAMMGNTTNCQVGMPPTEVGRWQGANGMDALPIAVSFGRMAPTPYQAVPGTAAVFRPYGIVQYGTRNAPHSF